MNSNQTILFKTILFKTIDQYNLFVKELLLLILEYVVRWEMEFVKKVDFDIDSAYSRTSIVEHQDHLYCVGYFDSILIYDQNMLIKIIKFPVAGHKMISS